MKHLPRRSFAFLDQRSVGADVSISLTVDTAFFRGGPRDHAHLVFLQQFGRWAEGCGEVEKVAAKEVDPAKKSEFSHTDGIWHLLGGGGTVQQKMCNLTLW